MDGRIAYRAWLYRAPFKRTACSLRPVHLYILLCPECGATRYAGQTTDLEMRLKSYITAEDKRIETRFIERWNRGLKDSGKNVVMRCVKTVYGDIAGDKAEKALIAELTKGNNFMLNMLVGGRGRQRRLRTVWTNCCRSNFGDKIGKPTYTIPETTDPAELRKIAEVLFGKPRVLTFDAVISDIPDGDVSRLPTDDWKRRVIEDPDFQAYCQYFQR
jgi:hypothetical protein